MRACSADVHFFFDSCDRCRAASVSYFRRICSTTVTSEMDAFNVVVALLAFVIQGGVTMRILDLRIPSHAVRSENAKLECNFDLDGEKLYSVKWYKDGNHEIYRYVPRDNPPSQVFQYPGVTIDKENSNATTLLLTNVQLDTTGIYKCEVSGEAPFFETVTESQHMTVVALPKEGPKISGGKPRYQVGDTVKVNCTSGRSKPAAKLDWMINGEAADQRYLRGPVVFNSGREGLETSVLGLEFVARHKHFRRGNMKLKCLATIATLYQLSNEESAKGDIVQKGVVLESRGTPAPSSRADRVQAAGSDQFLPRLYLLATCYVITSIPVASVR